MRLSKVLRPITILLEMTKASTLRCAWHDRMILQSRSSARPGFGSHP